jgi:hypothetical protein
MLNYRGNKHLSACMPCPALRCSNSQQPFPCRPSPRPSTQPEELAAGRPPGGFDLSDAEGDNLMTLSKQLPSGERLTIDVLVDEQVRAGVQRCAVQRLSVRACWGLHAVLAADGCLPARLPARLPSRLPAPPPACLRIESLHLLLIPAAPSGSLPASQTPPRRLSLAACRTCPALPHSLRRSWLRMRAAPWMPMWAPSSPPPSPRGTPALCEWAAWVWCGRGGKAAWCERCSRVQSGAHRMATAPLDPASQPGRPAPVHAVQLRACTGNLFTPSTSATGEHCPPARSFECKSDGQYFVVNHASLEPAGGEEASDSTYTGPVSEPPSQQAGRRAARLPPSASSAASPNCAEWALPGALLLSPSPLPALLAPGVRGAG